MTKLSCTALVLAWLARAAAAQEPVVYEIGFENADHHEAEVAVTFPNVELETLELRMSRSSPGRYALHEFAKNVYDVRVRDGRGRVLSVTRPNPHGWNVRGHDGTVQVRYTVYGDRCDGTYLAVDNTHAHLNAPATFLWARGMEDRPVRLVIAAPGEDWKVATQLAPTAEENVFTAPDLAYFLDSPVEVSPFELHAWEVTSDGKTQTIRLALHHQGTEAEGAAYAELAEAVVREQMRIFGELPDFDFGTYTFIADYLPYADGDGMEHRNSTILSSTRSLDQPIRNLGTLAHEFFHAWNVERIRPRSLEPFDFERANMSGELWFAEGFTSYYDDLTLKRAGITSLDHYAGQIASVLDAVLNAPGRRFFSPVGMSQRAPLVDGAASIDPDNRANTYLSYYSYGAVLALGLDLTMRQRFPGTSLDDFMRAAWQRHGKSEIPYTLAELESILAELTEPGFAERFFANFVHESELPDFEILLASAGLELRRAKQDEVWLGGRVRESGGRVRVDGASQIGGPLYEAGLDRGDVLVELDGRSITDESSWREALAAHRPGERAPIVFEKRGERRVSEIVFQGDPTVSVVPFERQGREITPEIRSFRESWLESASHREQRVGSLSGAPRSPGSPGRKEPTPRSRTR